jgi:hypothetical protein
LSAEYRDDVTCAGSVDWPEELLKVFGKYAMLLRVVVEDAETVFCEVVVEALSELPVFSRE